MCYSTLCLTKLGPPSEREVICVSLKKDPKIGLGKHQQSVIKVFSDPKKNWIQLLDALFHFMYSRRALIYRQQWLLLSSHYLYFQYV